MRPLGLPRWTLNSLYERKEKKNTDTGPVWVVQLVQYTIVAGSNPGHIQESTNDYINKWNTNQCFSLSLSLPFSLSLKSVFKKDTDTHEDEGRG